MTGVFYERIQLYSILVRQHIGTTVHTMVPDSTAVHNSSRCPTVRRKEQIQA